MTLSIAAEPVPLNAGEDGVIRVAGTRVTLDTVVTAFQQGATPEEIVQQYDSLDLKIAATALVQNALLLSANLRDFQQVPGLHVEDWRQ